MELGTAFAIVRRHKWVWLVPTALGLGWLMISLLLGAIPAVKEGVHFKFTVPNGMPSLDSILQMQQQPINEAMGGPVLLLTVIGMAIGAFLTGGWLAGVFSALRQQDTDQAEFMENCQRFFGRLLAARLITFVVMVFGVLTLAMVLGPLVFVLMLVALIYTFFWELAIVREDLSVSEGFTRGHRLLTGRLGEVLGFLLPIGLLTGFLSVFANLLAQSFVGYVLMIPVWSFIGGGFSVAVAALYDRLVDPSPPAIEHTF